MTLRKSFNNSIKKNLILLLGLILTLFALFLIVGATRNKVLISKRELSAALNEKMADYRMFVSSIAIGINMGIHGQHICNTEYPLKEDILVLHDCLEKLNANMPIAPEYSAILSTESGRIIYASPPSWEDKRLLIPQVARFPFGKSENFSFVDRSFREFQSRLVVGRFIKNSQGETKTAMVTVFNLSRIMGIIKSGWLSRELEMDVFALQKDGLPLTDLPWRKDLSLPQDYPVLYYKWSEIPLSPNPSFYWNPGGVFVLGASVKMPDSDLIFVAEITFEKLFFHVLQILAGYTILMLLGTLAASLMIKKTSTMITSDLIILGKAVRHLSADLYSGESFAGICDSMQAIETYGLAVSFSEMRLGLEMSSRKITDIHEKTLAVSSAILSLQSCEKTEDFYDKLTHKIPTLFNMENGLLLIKDPAKNTLIPYTCIPDDTDLMYALSSGILIDIGRTDDGRDLLLLLYGGDAVQDPCVDAKRDWINPLMSGIMATHHLVSLREKLERDSITDALTGIFNRRYLFNRLLGEIKRANRFGYPLSVVYMDLDGFKKINDIFGHQQGDAILSKFGGILLRAVRENVDISARYGGDEFCVILPETGLAGAKTFASRLLDMVKESFNGEIDVSIGIAELMAGENSDDIIRRADAAMYKAKSAGGGRIEGE